MSSILKTPTLLAPAARESKRGQQSLETQRARALRVFYAALADRRSNPCNIVVMGDSMTEGQGATAWGARWVDRFRDQMRQKFPVTGVTGGVGYISTTNGLTGGSASIFPVAHSGTVSTNSQSGPKKRSRVFSASGHITTWTVTGTAVDLVYWQGTSTGTVKWSVDGGATTNQSTAGASAASGTMLRISLGTAGVHTVTVEWVSGTSYVEGLVVYNGDETTGVRVHEAGRSGISAYQWDQANHEATTSWARAISQLNPHLLIIALGINDWAQSTAAGGGAGTAADYKTYLKSLIADVRSNTTIDPSIMLLSYATPNASPYDTAYSFAQYADVCEQIAAEDAEVCTLDLGLRLPKVSGDVLSLYSDTTHPNNKGHAMIADLVMQVLGAGGGAGIGTGDVVGPASSTDGRVATFSGTTGKLIQDGGTLLSGLLTSATAASTYATLAGTSALVDAKGDLLVGSAADTLARLAVGNDGESPVADANSTNGLRFSRMGFSLIRSGGYTTPAGTYGTSNQTVNRLCYLPLIIPRRTTFDRIAVNHTGTTGGVGSVARLGIYANATSGGDKPGALILDAGTVDTTTAAALKPITISQALDPGLYWVCCVSQWVTTNPVFTSVSVTFPPVPDTSGTTSGSYFESSVAGTLPSTATPSATVATSAPLVYLRSA